MGVQSEAPFGERAHRPGLAATDVVEIVQRSGERDSDLGLQRRQHYRAGFVEVVDVDGDPDAVGGACRVRGGYGYGVILGRFIVQGGLGPQLAVGGANVEGGRAVDVQGVGQGIVVGVGGRDGLADVLARCGVLVHVALSGVGRELGRLIRRHRHWQHAVNRVRLGALARPFSIGVGGGGLQVVAHIGGNRRVGG